MKPSVTAGFVVQRVPRFIDDIRNELGYFLGYFSPPSPLEVLRYDAHPYRRKERQTQRKTL